MKSSNKTIVLAISGALALSIGVANVQAASNPFAIKSLSSGYQVADATADTGTKMKDGKCGTGKCGANKKKAMKKLKWKKRRLIKAKKAHAVQKKPLKANAVLI